MAASPVAILLQSLRECQLLELDQLDAIAKHPLAQGDDAKALVRELVNRKWLTNYQVNLLAQGRGRELVVGQYRIVERLGEGNMGSVFKAVHHSMRRVVALKVIRKERLAHPDIVKRFHQEIKAAAQLVHPNIVLAFDAGQADGTHYYAMEYVEGSDLARRVQEQGPLPVLEACDYIRQAAQGLQHAHERGFVHRDIKPANLLVDRQTKTVKILDLGLARLQGAEGEHGLTRVGTTVGTPGYLAPEQALNARTVDIRADLYSLGCTFFYLLAGQAPFRGSNALEVIVKHRTEEAPGLFMYREDVPAAVQNIVRKLMAKKPEDRYQSPEELVQALLPFQPKSGEVLPAPVLRNRGPGKASTPSVQLPTSARRGRPWLAAAVAAGLFGALFLGTVLLVALFGFAPEEGPRDKGLTQAPPPGTSEPPKAEPPIRPEPEPEPEPKPEPKRQPEPQPEPKTAPKQEPPKPEPKPQPEPPPKPEPKPEPKPLPGKLAVPAGPALTLAESQVRSRFKADYARKKPAELRALAARLLDEAGKTMDPVERFVLLREARELAAQAGDLETAFRAAEETDRAYVVSLLELKIAVLERASRVPLQAGELQTVIDTATSIAEGLIDEDDYGPAGRLLKSAEQAASSARLVPELARIRNRIKEVALLAKEYEAVRPARERLKSDPNDPEANYQWGRFLCLIKGHWAQGLPYLAAGSNVPLREQAKKDLARPNDVEGRLEVANGWFALGSAEREAVPASPAAVQLLQRARVWYELTVHKGETPPLTEQRLQEIARLLVREEPPPPVKPPVSAPMDNRTRWNNLILAARNAFREGNYAEALKRYNEALEIYPKDGTALQGIKQVQQAQYQQAMAAGQKALLAGRYGEAIKEFKLALEASPNDELARKLLRQAEVAHFSIKNVRP